MNKTVTINISGIIFHIEEDAYESLSRYLTTIKGYFSKTDGGNEIMGDIEARIAELLQAKTNAVKQVVLMNDVQEVMQVMGKPEDFGAENPADEQAKPETEMPRGDEKIKRRLFRDPDERAIGGVCSGLAAYFDIDTVWVRLAMVLLVIFGGLSLWVYIIMWIIIPQAKTTADKFAMRGETANINNILRSFKEEAQDVKNRFNKYGSEFKDHPYGDAVRTGVSRVLYVVLNILARLVGLFIFLVGGVLLVAYVISLFGISVASSNTDITKWKHVIFDSTTDYGLGVLAFIIVCGVPVFMLLYSGIKLMFRIHYRNRWLNVSLGILWTLGLILGLYLAVGTAKQFNEHSRLKESVELHGMGDTIVIRLNPALTNLKTWGFENDDDLEHYLSHGHGGYYFGDDGKKISIVGFADINVAESTTDSVEMIISRVARGNSKKEANENAKAIKYAYHQVRNELIFDEIYLVDAGSKFRAQELTIKIRVPKGKVVYFDKSVKHSLNDIENTTNTWEGDMIDHRWKMTDKGLECLDCPPSENSDASSENEEPQEVKHKNVIINDRGIHVKSENTEIKIDENGIKIKTPEKSLDIQKDTHNKE